MIMILRQTLNPVDQIYIYMSLSFNLYLAQEYLNGQGRELIPNTPNILTNTQPFSNEPLLKGMCH